MILKLTVKNKETIIVEKLRKEKIKDDLPYELIKHKATKIENVCICKRSDKTVEKIREP